MPVLTLVVVVIIIIIIIILISGVAKGGMGACSWKFFQSILFLLCWIFLCILFSRILSMCLRLRSHTPHRGSASGPRLGTCGPRPPILSPVANSWLRPWSSSLADHHHHHHHPGVISWVTSTTIKDVPDSAPFPAGIASGHFWRIRPNLAPAKSLAGFGGLQHSQCTRTILQLKVMRLVFSCHLRFNAPSIATDCTNIMTLHGWLGGVTVMASDLRSRSSTLVH